MRKETKRLILRPFSEDDPAAANMTMHHFWQDVVYFTLWSNADPAPRSPRSKHEVYADLIVRQVGTSLILFQLLCAGVELTRKCFYVITPIRHTTESSKNR